MQVFKTFFRILKKYMTSILVYSVIFFVICLFSSGTSNESSQTNFTSEKTNVAIIDRDQSTLSKELSAYLGTIHQIVDIEDNTEAMQNDLFYRNVSYILIIPEGFGANLTSGNMENLVQNVKVPNSYSGTYVDNQIEQYINTLHTYLSAGYDEAAAVKSTENTLSLTTEVTIQNDSSNGSNEPIYYYFQYLAYILVCIILTGLGPVLVRFNDKEILSRTNASMLTLRSRNLQLILGSTVFALACYVIFMVVCALLYGSKLFTTQGALFMINSFIFLIVSVAITFLVCNLTTSIEAIGGIANTIGLGMSFLCGVFVPTSIMSSKVLAASRILPAYWYINAHNMITTYNGSSSELQKIWINFGIEVIFVIILFALGAFVSKRKRTRS